MSFDVLCTCKTFLIPLNKKYLTTTIFANHVPNDLDLIAIVEEFGCWNPEGLRVVRMEAEHFGVQLRYIWTYTYDMNM